MSTSRKTAAAKPTSPLSAELVPGSQAEVLVDDFAGARLNDLLGGVMRGAVVLVVGAGASGKSTAAAELAARAAEHWASPAAGKLKTECPLYWLDADVGAPGLVRSIFADASLEDIFVARAKLLPLHCAGTIPLAEALDLVPSDARVLVVDSLDGWAHSGQAQLAAMEALRWHRAWLKIITAGTSEDHLTGAVSRAADVVVFAERTADGRRVLRLDRRRWQPSPSAAARGAGARRPPEPPPAPPPAAAEEEWPDFSAEFIAKASVWGAREREEYLARCRKRGVHRASIQGWREAVNERRAAVTAAAPSSRPVKARA